mgnify:FL=1
MSRYIVNMIMAGAVYILLYRGIKRGLIIKSRGITAGVVIMLSAGMFLFDSSTMAVWSLLVFQSYMDITEGQVLSVVTYFMTTVQAVHCIVYCLISTPALPASTLLFPTILITGMSVAGAYAAGDAEIFLMIMLHSYSRGIRPDAYMTALIFLSLVIFAVYTGFVNLVRVLRHEAALKRAAFVPAITWGYLMLDLLEILQR